MGYSGIPLEKKLGLKHEQHCVIYQPPKTYLKWIKSLSLDLKLEEAKSIRSSDFIHAFFKKNSDLENTIPTLKKSLAWNGMLWVSWPKGGSTIKTDLNRDRVRECVLAIGLVDSKVASVDDDWSALKFVYRLKDRK